MARKPLEPKLKSLSLYTPVETVVEQILNLGFREIATATIIADSKFWDRHVFKKGHETIVISDEIGDADYLRDPVVTICGGSETIETLKRLE
jgi:hypothetical protein